MADNLAQIYFSAPFLAQVAPGQNQYLKNAKWEDAHGDRVRIRIPGVHPSSGQIKDADLPWAIVSKSTSHGNRSGGSTGIWGGEWVMVCYMNRGGEQIPVITQVFGNNLADYDIRESKNGTTSFQRVDRYNNGLAPAAHQVIGDSTKPTAPVQPTKSEFKNAMKTPRPNSLLTQEEYNEAYRQGFAQSFGGVDNIPSSFRNEDSQRLLDQFNAAAPST
jgi:hypothetical protein